MLSFTFDVSKNNGMYDVPANTWQQGAFIVIPKIK